MSQPSKEETHSSDATSDKPVVPGRVKRSVFDAVAFRKNGIQIARRLSGHYLAKIDDVAASTVLEQMPTTSVIQGGLFSQKLFSGSNIDPEFALSNVTYLNCIFDECTFRGEVIFGNFIRCTFHKCIFLSPRMDLTNFRNCVFKSNHFDNLTTFKNSRMYSCFGLHRNRNLHLAQVEKQGQVGFDADLRSATVPFVERFGSWEAMRAVGKLPIFGVSFSALVAIPLLTFMLAFYNEQIRQFQGWASTHSDNFAMSLPSVSELVGRMQPIALPSLTFWLLISTVLLGIGSTLYALVCPPRIKAFSLEQWTDQLGHPVLQYLPLAWKHRPVRIIAWICYIFGGAGSLIILVFKLWNTGKFIITNTTLPFWFW